MFFSAWPYALAYLLPFSLFLGHLLGGGWGYFYPLLLGFGLIPLLDLLVGENKTNPSSGQEEAMEKSWSFDGVIWFFIPLQFFLIFWGAHLVGQDKLSGGEFLGLTFSVGIICGGSGITIAHELIHRKNRWEQFLGETLLLGVCYMHFSLEHRLGHHLRVGTFADPATARLGESFYAFFPRTLKGGMMNSWGYEKKRLKRLGLSSLHYRNKMIWFCFLPLVLAATLGIFGGGKAVLFFFLQSFVAISLLELVNYVEHYGLTRKENEKVKLTHSWNSDYFLSNRMLFNLQRHSDHHIHPRRKYPGLQSFPESPSLPYSYPLMIMLALLPPLWRKVMDGKKLNN